jgi:hypothetical protein
MPHKVSIGRSRAGGAEVVGAGGRISVFYVACGTGFHPVRENDSRKK